MVERGLGQAGGAAPAGCADFVETGASHLPAKARTQLRRARVLSLRLEDTRAFAIYESAGGQVHAIPMTRERGTWRVGAIAGAPLS